MITAAILLAAGRGKRQRPFTDVTPKPLLAVNGRATLDYVLQAVRRAGITRACLVTNHLEEQIKAYVGDGAKWQLSATFAHQAELRGNGDALLGVPHAWRPAEPVLVTATDYVLEEQTLLELVEAHARARVDITMSIKECPHEELAARSSVQVDADWRIRRIIEKPRPDEIMSPYAASAIAILPPQAWDYLARVQPSPRSEIEMQSAIQLMLEAGFTAQGVLQPAPLEWTAPEHGEITT